MRHSLRAALVTAAAMVSALLVAPARAQFGDGDSPSILINEIEQNLGLFVHGPDIVHDEYGQGSRRTGNFSLLPGVVMVVAQTQDQNWFFGAVGNEYMYGRLVAAGTDDLVGDSYKIINLPFEGGTSKILAKVEGPGAYQLAINAKAHNNWRVQVYQVTRGLERFNFRELPADAPSVFGAQGFRVSERIKFSRPGYWEVTCAIGSQHSITQWDSIEVDLYDTVGRGVESFCYSTRSDGERMTTHMHYVQPVRAEDVFMLQGRPGTNGFSPLRGGPNIFPYSIRFRYVGERLP